jgi:DNA polymerase III alpha subunit
MIEKTSYNEYIVTESDLVNLMLQGINFNEVTTTDMQAIEQYNHFCNLFMLDGVIEANTPADTNDKYSYKFVENWHMPDHYKNLSIELELIHKLESMGYRENSIQWKRVRDEYAEFESRGLDPLLKYMIYLVDLMRENNIVWGVGRGSSVASYILYLIGVHKIDSIKYELDYKEFFR